MIDESRVLLVEDDRRVSNAIRAILTTAGYTDVEVVETSARAEERVAVSPPTLMLVDLGLPDRDGADLIRSLRARAFRQPILVLTSATDDAHILNALRAGADGYLFKEDLDVKLAVALRDLTQGGAPLSPGAAKVVLRELGLDRPSVAVPRLTQRESAVLTLLATGGSYTEIARELKIELNTVRSHMRSLYDKLGVENRAEAVNLAWNLGILRRTT